MSRAKPAEQNGDCAPVATRRAWTAPALVRMHAGDAESGPGASGETNSLS